MLKKPFDRLFLSFFGLLALFIVRPAIIIVPRILTLIAIWYWKLFWNIIIFNVHFMTFGMILLLLPNRLWTLLMIHISTAVLILVVFHAIVWIALILIVRVVNIVLIVEWEGMIRRVVEFAFSLLKIGAVGTVPAWSVAMIEVHEYKYFNFDYKLSIF